MKNSKQDTKTYPSGKHDTKKHSINRTKFLPSSNDQKDLDISYDTDTIVDLKEDDVIQAVHNDEKDKWVTALNRIALEVSTKSSHSSLPIS